MVGVPTFQLDTKEGDPLCGSPFLEIDEKRPSRSGESELILACPVRENERLAFRRPLGYLGEDRHVGGLHAAPCGRTRNLGRRKCSDCEHPVRLGGVGTARGVHAGNDTADRGCSVTRP